MKSVLLIGQSNMAGRGFLNEAAPIYNENIFMLRNGRWQMMTEPIHFTAQLPARDRRHHLHRHGAERIKMNKSD